MDDNNAPVSGVNVEIFRVADKNGSNFSITDDFKNSGVNVEELLQGNSASTASDLEQFVFSRGLNGQVKTTTSYGAASFYGQAEGIYLVMERGNQKVSFNPYLMMLPTSVGGTHHYLVVSQPKISETDTLAIRVTVKWVDNNNASKLRPDGVMVQLLQENARPAARMLRMSRGSSVFRMVSIDEDMNWTYVFTGLDESGVYDVLELPVQGYDTTYSGDMGQGFVITNTIQHSDPGPWYPEDPDEPVAPDNPDTPDIPDDPDEPDNPDGPGIDEPYEPDNPYVPGTVNPDKPKIPQTGAVLWPVFLMLVLGTAMVVAGAAEILSAGKVRKEQGAK